MTEITDRQIAEFDRTGFLRIEQLVSAEALGDLREAYDDIVGHEVGPDSEQMLGGITRRVMFPSRLDARFDDNPVLTAGMDAGSRLLGAPVQRVFDMLIAKPPGHPHETPWHQDLSYSVIPFAPAGALPRARTLQFWIAMDDADTENGCMHFIPGHHRQPMLEHVVASGAIDDPHRLLAIADPRVVAASAVVACPVPAGGCTVHTDNTLHYTPPNRSADRARRAYIFNLVASV